MFVRVDCPLEELERREKLRGDRSPGQAKWQYEHIHQHGTYDLTVNTFEMTVEACAVEIIKLLDRVEEWKAFRDIKDHLDHSSARAVEPDI
jgi:chloramphenicol 3-O phosphotransferase